MEPSEVANIYSQQADAMRRFLLSVDNMKGVSADEYKQMLVLISEKYAELLETLAAFTPLLAEYKVTFYRLNDLAHTLNLNEPPFDVAFFNSLDL